jgi:CRISPR-associated exonuclease Cas4
MRKVWLCAHQMNMEQNSENVKIGKLIDETTYKREKHDFMIDNTVNIDFLKNNIVHEIKKSDKEKNMAINQIKYYLFILKNYGFAGIEGCLSIPLKKHKETVLLEEKDDDEIIKQLNIIHSIIKDNKIPEPINKKTCRKCAYFDLCYI